MYSGIPLQIIKFFIRSRFLLPTLVFLWIGSGSPRSRRIQPPRPYSQANYSLPVQKGRSNVRQNFPLRSLATQASQGSADDYSMSLHSHLEQLQPADLPSPPQAALEILRACTREDIDARQIANFAKSDPLLCSELLRVVNSPLYGLGKQLTSLDQAIAILGMRALRNLVLCIMVRDVAMQPLSSKFDLSAFWEDSLRRAVSARELGRHLQLDRDDCFTAGLLQDIGLLILCYLYPEHAKQHAELRYLDPATRYARELNLFASSHTQIALLLAQHWSLPELFAQAISDHHHPQFATGCDSSKLAWILHCADWTDAVFHSQQTPSSLASCKQHLTTLGLSPEQIDQHLALLPVAVEISASALGLRINKQTDFAHLLRQTNLTLAQENRSYQELTWQLEKALAERDRLAHALQEEIAIAQEVQRHLMPPDDPADLSIAGLNLPAGNLSGDFYDFIRFADGRIYFALGDVSGKGIHAALLMAKTSSLFRCLAKQGHPPTQLLTMLNAELCDTSTRGFFVTMIAGLYFPARQEVVLANAGHLPALWINDQQQLKTYPATNPPLGILAQTIFVAQPAIALQHATLYLYSDGITEAKQASGQALELKGLAALLIKHRALAPRQRLQQIIAQLKPAYSLHDDITLLAVESR